MLMLLSPLLAAMAFAQALPTLTVTGEVVDDWGQPVADFPVVFYLPPSQSGREYQAEARTRTDAEGRFRMTLPRSGGSLDGDRNFLAYRPGSAITATSLRRRPYRVILRKPEPRTIRIAGHDGRPIAGARVTPRVLHVFDGDATAEIPESMAAPLAVVTGPDGRATFNYLAARDQLVAARVAADPIGTQDFLLVDRPGRSSVEPVIAIRLKKTSRLAGRIVDGAGQPVADQVVEIWSRGGEYGLGPNPVELRGGPLRTKADGRFQTPDNLLVGSTYRLAVRAPGKEPILSDWIEIGEQPRTLLPMTLLALRTVGGRVVDRRGKPVADVEVFQAGDGPEPTATKTDADGRFALDGFRQGPVFLFARGEGFRFHGQLIKEAEREVTVELTRTGERPLREMTMLPEPIPLEESRAMARRLIEPVWKLAVAKGDDGPWYSTLQALVNIDPAEALEKLESAKFAAGVWESRMRSEIAAALAGSDPEEAAAVAESIADPALRAGALMEVVDALPAAERPRQLALLDRAVLESRAISDPADRIWRMGDAAERLYKLGELHKARALFAEGLRIANQMTDKKVYARAQFAAQLSLVNAPAALAIARELKGSRMGGAMTVVYGLRLTEPDPAECVRFWKEMRSVSRGGLASMYWNLAKVDSSRARQLIERLGFVGEPRPETFVYMALGEKDRDESASRRSLEGGLQRLDQLMRERPEQIESRAGYVLHVVERIDPARVPEFAWRYVASRPPFANPRTISYFYSPIDLIKHLAWYDREVSAALFEPTRARIEHTEDRELATWGSEFEAWASFDPRAAAARLEKVPVSSGTAWYANLARIRVATLLGLSYEQRLRKTWRDWEILFGESRRGF